MKENFVVVAVLAFAIAIMLVALSNCAGDRLKGDAPVESQDTQRDKIIQQGKDFCVKYPNDIACPNSGPGVRKK